MTDTNNTSNTQNNSTNNSNNNSSGGTNSGNSTYGGGGKKICFGADSGCYQDDCDKIKAALEQCGNTVTFTCIDPNQESHMKGSGADFNVFFCNGVAPATMWSFREAIKSGSLPFTIFAFITGPPYYDPNATRQTLKSMETIRAVKFEPEWDANFMTGSSTSSMQSETVGDGTLGPWIDANSQYVSLCSGNTPEELAQNICNGSCGGGSGTGTASSSGSGVQIKDRTFEECIRRICAATDSVFLVENNAAVLFPYTDWMAFTLRAKINKITASEIDPDLFSMQYFNEGTYNKVTVTWGGEELPERYPNNPSTKARERRKQHTTTTEKTNADGSVTLSEQYDALVDMYGELEKRVATKSPNRETAQYVANALLIQYVREFNASCRLRTLNSKKYIGGTFYAVENIFLHQSELLFLNGYTMRTQKDEPLYVDLEFKYGPEGAEEILDLQTIVGGGAAATGGNTTVGGESADINELAQQICNGITDELSKAKAIHQWLIQNVTYSLYSCSHYSTPSECLQHKNELNCADTSRLTRAMMSAAGLQATVVHGPNHFWTIMTIGGQEYASDATSKSRAFNTVWKGLSYYAKCGDSPSC